MIDGGSSDGDEVGASVEATEAAAALEADADADDTLEEGRARPAAQRIGDFIVPYGYEVWGDGLYYLLEPLDDEDIAEAPDGPCLDLTPATSRRQKLHAVAESPLWIRQLGRITGAVSGDSEGEVIIELAFRDVVSREIVGFWTDRYSIASKTSIVKLARFGVPVTDGNASSVVRYLDIGLHRNGGKLTCSLIAARSGASYLARAVAPDGSLRSMDGWGWLIGTRWIGPAGTVVVPDPRERHSLIRGLGVSGDKGEWLTKWLEVVESGPIARWLCYAALTPPLLRFIQQRSFVVHQWSQSGLGKSSIARFSMSAWGDPQKLMATFNRTTISFTEVFAYVDDVPVWFDELQSTRNPDDIAASIYALCGEKGRGRAGTAGGLQKEVEGWHTVVRMTGEEPLIGKGGVVDLGGQANRVVQISAPALASEEVARSLHQWCERQHAGWGAVLFLEGLQRLLAEPDGHERLVRQYLVLRDAVRAELHGAAVHSRDYALTAVALTEYLAERWFFGQDGNVAFARAVAGAVAVGEAIAKDDTREAPADTALGLFHDHRVANGRLWFDLSVPEHNQAVAENRTRALFGIIAGSEVWLVQREANSLLSKHRLPPRRVWADLRASGRLVVPQANAGAYGCIRRHGEFRYRVYVLDRERVGI